MKMEGSHRNRSYSVPILTQIEKVLDRAEEDCVVERRASEGSRFLETRSPRNITRPKVKLSSGGLIRKQKRRHSRAVMENTKTDSLRQGHERNEEARPRAFTSSTIDGNTGNNLEPTLTAIHTSEQSAVPVRSKRCKSLPFLIPEEYSQQGINGGSNTGEELEEIGCRALNREQTTETLTSGEGYREDELTLRRLSLPVSIQHEFEDRGKNSHSETTDMTNSSTLDFTNLDKSNSLITDFDKLSMIKLKSGKQDMEDEFFQSDFERRRTSLPCHLEQSNLSTEACSEKSGFASDFRVDSVSQKTVKIKARQRSQSLPLTSLRFVGEPRVPLKEDYPNFSNCRHGEYCFRQPLDHIDKSNEHSRERKKSRRTRSKSLPLVLDEAGKANMSLSLRKHARQSSLQSHDSSHDSNTKARRTQSLPFIYEGFNEQEVLCDAEIIQLHSQTHNDGSSEKERAVNTERKPLHGNGSIKHKAPLERARSLPLRLQGAQHRQISDIREDLNKAIDIFFSQINDKDHNVGFRGRSKSLPAVLEGKRSLDFTPVAKILEDDSNIPEIVIAEGNFYDTVGIEDCESQIDRESMPSFPEEEKILNEESNSDGSSDCEDLEAQISNSSFVADPPLVVRARGFSIPASFKMEKIPEEPNENENFETLSSCGEQGGNKHETNFLCEDQLNETTDCQAPVENVIVSEERRGVLRSQIVHDEVSSARDTVEEQQEPTNDYEHNIEIFNKMVAESSSRVQQLAFAESSSCLHRAAANGDLEHVKLLVEEGHDVNILDESGWPVLHAAVTTGNFDCCAWLIDAGADLVEYTNFVIDEYRILCRQVYLNY